MPDAAASVILGSLLGTTLTPEEIKFFKEVKPQFTSKLIYYNQIYQIERKKPSGGDRILKKYYNNELAKLKEYKNPETLAGCPYFWLSTPTQDCLYRIFSVHTAGTQSSTYTVRFPDATSYRKWLEKMSAASEVETGAELNESETVVTLSTCTGDSAIRQVVQGIRIAENQKERK